MSRRESLHLTCDTCGFEDYEPMHGIAEVASMRLRERGWQITQKYDYCSFCVTGGDNT